jgi:hypothetical protein
MNSLQEAAWLRRGEPRRVLGSFLCKLYPGGGAVTECGYRLVGWFNKAGECYDLMPPWRSVHFSKTANAPKAQENCPCLEFYDAEIQGPWKMRNSPEHHPQCQFEPASMKVWSTLYKRGIVAPMGIDPQTLKPVELRPDAMEKIRQECRNQ